MATWQLLANEAAKKTWDESLVRLNDYSSFQTYAWGQYQRALGWEPCYWAAFDENGGVVAMLLGLLRRYPLGIGLIWSEGGPVGDLSACDASLQKEILKATGLKRVYCRFRCDRQRHVEDSLRLNAQGWCRSWFNLTTCYSLMLELQNEESKILSGCDRNWRRNLRRALESNLEVQRWTNPCVDDVVSAYNSMQSLKGLDEQHSREEFEYLFVHLKDHLLIYRSTDEQGQLVSLHGWLILGNRATAFLSATTERGRDPAFLLRGDLGDDPTLPASSGAVLRLGRNRPDSEPRHVQIQEGHRRVADRIFGRMGLGQPAMAAMVWKLGHQPPQSA